MGSDLIFVAGELQWLDCGCDWGFFFFFLLGSGKFSFKSILMSCMLKVRYEMSDEL